MRISANQGSKTRVLHIVGGMNRGGVETWLMHVLRHMNTGRLAIDFLVHTQEPCIYDEEIRARGSRIIPCMHPKSPLRYAWNFIRVLKSCGPYDVVHSHVHHFSGFTLSLARLGGVPVRIAHSHNDSYRIDEISNGFRHIYLQVMKRLVRMNATSLLAASRQAGRALFGLEWEKNERSGVLLYGLDLSHFRNGPSARNVRNDLGLPEKAFIIGHVGSFREGKNHLLMIDIAAEILKRHADLRLLLVGDGPLRSTVEQKAARMGILDNVILTGVRSDVPALMKGAMDVFVMPSTSEGLGLVCVEAQAAGLPLVISDKIPPEVDVIPGLVERIPLSAPPSLWAESLLSMKGKKTVGGEGIEAIEKSPFVIAKCVERLEEIYAGKSPSCF